MEKHIKEKKILDFLATGEKITNYQATVLFGYTDFRSFRCRYNKTHSNAKIISEKAEKGSFHFYSLVEQAA